MSPERNHVADRSADRMGSVVEEWSLGAPAVVRQCVVLRSTDPYGWLMLAVTPAGGSSPDRGIGLRALRRQSAAANRQDVWPERGCAATSVRGPSRASGCNDRVDSSADLSRRR